MSVRTGLYQLQVYYINRGEPPTPHTFKEENMKCQTCSRDIVAGDPFVLTNKQDYNHFECFLLKHSTFAATMAIAMENMRKEIVRKGVM